MATVIGYCKNILKKFTCMHCGAIVEYAPNEVKPTGHTDEGTEIEGLCCPNCYKFHRTNP